MPQATCPGCYNHQLALLVDFLSLCAFLAFLGGRYMLDCFVLTNENTRIQYDIKVNSSTFNLCIKIGQSGEYTPQLQYRYIL